MAAGAAPLTDVWDVTHSSGSDCVFDRKGMTLAAGLSGFQKLKRPGAESPASLICRTAIWVDGANGALLREQRYPAFAESLFSISAASAI